MKTFYINNRLSLYETDTRSVSTSRSGFARITEAELLERLAAALKARDSIDDAIEDMRSLLVTGGE